MSSVSLRLGTTEDKSEPEAPAYAAAWAEFTLLGENSMHIDLRRLMLPRQECILFVLGISRQCLCEPLMNPDRVYFIC